ncbi:RNA polymerase sigma factor [Falsibacillus pallidus]|uniref:RNA polymerase sigma factor n=1 Tax=Falsibacillus pallidus TaxID=493781 RepID=UPI003D9879CF
MTEKERITQWFYEYSDDLYHYFYYRLGKSDAEDLVQEVFIKALNGIKSFNGNSTPKTWLFRIALNAATDKIRRERRARFGLAAIFQNEHFKPENAGASPERMAEMNESSRELYEAIHQLKGSYRNVLILRGIKEFSVGETAAILEWSPQKVRSTYYRAKEALARKLGGDYDA